MRSVSLLALFAVVLAACAIDRPGGEGSPSWYQPGSNAEKGDVAVYRSPNDSRSYRHLTLDNGLSVLLVSDPDSDKAAASLSVNVGSFDNPRDRDGLAHFLEHMLFLGTDKYPEPGEYQSFISEHGGTFNAYTALEETNYFFDVEARHLIPALDRFSRFFVAPLFNPEYVDRERNAVESEYRLKFKDDSRREWDVLSELASEDHPFSGFSVGNLETLANRDGDPIREDLIDFYKRYYSATGMKLVVLGQENLDTLEKAVTGRFAEVPRRDVDFPQDRAPLFREPTPFVAEIQPEQELRNLSFYFPMPSVKGYWAEKPMDYFGHLLGHEGEGSLLANLKAEGLAEGLSSGLMYDSRAGAVFAVRIALTEAGVEQRDRITKAFFEWLQLVRQQGLDSWRYRELATMSELEFRFAQKSNPIHYVSRLSSGMHQFPPQEAVRGPYRFGDFNKDLLQQLGQHLDSNNAAITLMAPGVETDRTSAFYQVPYRVTPLSLEATDASGFELALPAPNPYIPQRVEVHEQQAGEVPRRLNAAPDSPMWFYGDNGFGTPKAVFEARLNVPGLDDLRRQTLLDIYLALVEDELSAETYPAALAGAGFGLGRWDNGFSLSVHGYSDTQSRLLGRVLDVLNSPDWHQGRFERVRHTLLRNWRNTRKSWPIRQLFERMPPMVVDRHLSVEKAEMLAELTLADVRRFHGGLALAGQPRFYAGGNSLPDQAADMAARVIGALGGGGEAQAFEPELAIANLPPRDQLPVARVTIDHEDSAALLYLQGRDDSLKERALMAVLQVAAEAPFYSQLRTERQLGYVVGSSVAHINRVPGLSYYVQSPVMDAEGLQREIDAFFSRFADTVAGLGEDEFARYQAAALTAVEEKPKNIRELAGRHLESLDLGYEQFDFRQRLADAIRLLTLPEFRAGYQRIFQGKREGFWLHSTREAGRDIRDVHLDAMQDNFIYPQ